MKEIKYMESSKIKIGKEFFTSPNNITLTDIHTIHYNKSRDESFLIQRKQSQFPKSFRIEKTILQLIKNLRKDSRKEYFPEFIHEVKYDNVRYLVSFLGKGKIKGVTLREFLDNFGQCSVPIGKVNTILSLIYNICDAVSLLEFFSINHRNLTSENILLIPPSNILIYNFSHSVGANLGEQDNLLLTDDLLKTDYYLQGYDLQTLFTTLLFENREKVNPEQNVFSKDNIINSKLGPPAMKFIRQNINVLTMKQFFGLLGKIPKEYHNQIRFTNVKFLYNNETVVLIPFIFENSEKTSGLIVRKEMFNFYPGNSRKFPPGKYFLGSLEEINEDENIDILTDPKYFLLPAGNFQFTGGEEEYKKLGLWLVPSHTESTTLISKDWINIEISGEPYPNLVTMIGSKKEPYQILKVD